MVVACAGVHGRQDSLDVFEPYWDRWRLWSVPGLVESAHLAQECGRLVAVDGLVLDWRVHSNAGVGPLTVVEDLEVLEDRVGEFDTGLPPFPVQQFDLHPGPERFDHGVVG